jgi:hypothetical protein
MPYSAVSITEFWQRWHTSSPPGSVTTSTLGGNLKGVTCTYINFILTMLLCGLWHGASWNFVFWGGIHGVSLAIHRAWMKWALAIFARESSNISVHMDSVFPSADARRGAGGMAFLPRRILVRCCRIPQPAHGMEPRRDSVCFALYNPLACAKGSQLGAGDSRALDPDAHRRLCSSSTPDRMPGCHRFYTL